MQTLLGLINVTVINTNSVIRCQLDPACIWDPASIWGFTVIVLWLCGGGITFLKVVRQILLADRTNGRAYATVMRPSFCRLPVTLCIVAKRQKLLYWQHTRYRKSYANWMTLTFAYRGRFKVMSTIASHSLLNISETDRDRGLVPLWGIEWSRDQWRHVTLKCQVLTPVRLSQYL